MIGRLAMLAALLALSACDRPPAMPPRPAALVVQEELPFGDRNMSRMTRGSLAAMDLLEPRFGKPDTEIYTVPEARVPELRRQIEQAMPKGWARLATSLPPERGELIAYAAGDRLYAVLIVPPAEGSDRPVVVLRSEK